MSRIAFFHNALGKTDGVSLEIDKWRRCLEKMGHRVFYCAGNDDVPGVTCIPELSFFHPEANKILKNATVKLTDYTEEQLGAAIQSQKGTIKAKLLSFISENGIDVLIPNNLMSVGYHLPALIALSEVIEESGLPTISHNHDFYFEDSGEVHPTCPTAQKILDRYVPAAFPNVQNLVINRLAQNALLKRKGLPSRVVPNVFDFKQPAWTLDEYNSDFRSALGIAEGDLVFLQATRVMNRKGIELAIDVIARLNDPAIRKGLTSAPLANGRRFTESNKIVLLCAGHIEEFGATASYHHELIARAERLKVDIRFVGNRVKHSRGRAAEGKIYSLWDSYAQADFVTYPSLWEGWGNQFIEAVFAKLPILLFEYPVFVSDLKADGFDVVSLGAEFPAKGPDGLPELDRGRADSAAREIAAVLTNSARHAKMVEHNFAVADERYSLTVLERIIRELLDAGGIADSRAA